MSKTRLKCLLLGYIFDVQIYESTFTLANYIDPGTYSKILL